MSPMNFPVLGNCIRSNWLWKSVLSSESQISALNLAKDMDAEDSNKSSEALMCELKNEQDAQDCKDHPTTCIKLINNQSELSRKFLMSQMRMNSTESTWCLPVIKLEETQEKMQSKRLSNVTDELSEVVSIPVNVYPTLKMSCLGESNAVSDFDTVAIDANISTTSSIAGASRKNLRRSDWKTVFGKEENQE